MCGIAGYFSKDTYISENVLLEMGKAVKHRGPDDSGIWHDRNSGIGLVHRRLSIQDLSKAGHQPMFSHNARYVISYNGEIYNHILLRDKVESIVGTKVKWKGSSDTETLLACIENLGIESTLENIKGMFAFALWDRESKKLVLARDRFGEKPLYYGIQNETLLFGSDLISLKKHPSFKGEINRDAVALLMRYGYIPSPKSIYTGIHKLPPSSYVIFESHDSIPTIKYYWSLSSVIKDNNDGLCSYDYRSAVQKLDELIGDSVEQQMISDVPLGTFLSGGIDSTLITALSQSRSSGQVRTFTAGFDDKLYNEAHHAKKLAKYLGTSHTELHISPEHALDAIQKMPDIYTEPFADPSQIPTFLIAELTKEHVTVGLSGDAGDEIFSGYNRYVLTERYWKKLNLIPQPIRYLISSSIEKVSPDRLNRTLSSIQKIFAVKHQQANIGEKLHKAAIALRAQTSDELYSSLVNRWQNTDELVIGTSKVQTLSDCFIHSSEKDIVHRMMETDLLTYLPDDILCKVDRASMFVGLESRAPFLDREVVEFAWGLPLNYKIKDGVGKSILRDVLYKYVPKELIDRPKMGFGLPISSWLRGPLKEWGNSLLDQDRLRKEGFFHAEKVRQKWVQHQSGAFNWQYQLWPILMFQLWLQNEK